MANAVKVIYTDADVDIKNLFFYVCGCKRKYKGNKEVSETFPSKNVVRDQKLMSEVESDTEKQM